MSLSPEQNPLRSRAATRLVERGVVGRLGRDRTLPARIELCPLDGERLDPLAVKDVFDRRLDRFEQPVERPRIDRASAAADVRASIILPMSS